MLMCAEAVVPTLSAAGYLGLGVAALLVGFVKTGLPPLGILIPVVLALTFPTKDSVGALVLFLVVGDLFAAAYYRRDADWGELARLLPPVVGGMVLGTVILGAVDDRLLRVLIGGLVLSLVTLEWVRSRYAAGLAVRRPLFRWGVGAAAGVATTLANAAGPIMGIYFLSFGLDKARFMGTTAVFFLVVNVSKLPVYGWLGMIQTPYLHAFALLSPMVVVGAILGRRFLSWIPQRAFHAAVMMLTAAASASLLLL
ncbi:MAG: sulfite exporter TauE/SafE family protein [Planctomycetota bacterium]|nr:sulfite exporter TauE/SafE family protein [Planctomycetota bacterium]MEC8651106.1 sulfite exporter TauE/SafE family protein [Planctomycetota bacterium]MEC9047559.1 sulfite exporter TauE/SafE family protein [Planctomycetota bacterium]